MAGYPLTRGPRACATCGAKNHPDWRKCQRCQSPLVVAAAVKSPAGAVAAARIRAVAPLAAIVAILATGGLLLLRGSHKPSGQPTESGGATVDDAMRTGVSGTTERVDITINQRGARLIPRRPPDRRGQEGDGALLAMSSRLPV